MLPVVPGAVVVVDGSEGCGAENAVNLIGRSEREGLGATPSGLHR